MTPSTGQPQLLLPIGDPAGIGPEVALKALADPPLPAPIALVADRELLRWHYRQLRPHVRSLADPDDLPVLEVPLAPSVRAEIRWGQGNAASGRASFAFLQAAIARALAGEASGLVTAPIAKSAWHAAGLAYPGQTEVLARQAGRDSVGMLFAARSPHTDWMLRVLLATTHVPLREVPQRLTPAHLSDQLAVLVASLAQDFGIARPRIAVAGLNPHSGEGGAMGTEERDWLQAWLAREQRERPEVTLVGPVPPDALWIAPARAWRAHQARAQAAHAYLALYHDQGLIPLKALAFEQAVNTTIGLPFVRTSPDHGTAFDIAGRGSADPASLKAAIALAAEMATRRVETGRPARSSIFYSGTR